MVSGWQEAASSFKFTANTKTIRNASDPDIERNNIWKKVLHTRAHQPSYFIAYVRTKAKCVMMQIRDHRYPTIIHQPRTRPVPSKPTPPGIGQYRVYTWFLNDFILNLV